MNTPTPLVVACLLFQGPSGILVAKRSWEGEQYFGLPADVITSDESIERCAYRVISLSGKAGKNLAMILKLGHWSHAGASNGHQWNGQPASLTIFAFPEASIVAPMSSDAEWVSLDEILTGSGRKFDVTIELLRQVLEKAAPATVSAA